MSTKKWTFLALILFALILLSAAIFNYIIDPYMKYHKPSEYGYNITNAIYSNPGIARNYDYNAVILGSSMCVNSKASEFDEKYGVTTVKLTYTAEYARNIKYIMDIVDQKHDVDMIFFGADIFSFVKPVNETNAAFPLYLYDNNALNDVKYLFNRDVLKDSFRTIRNKLEKMPTTSMDDCYSWYNGSIDSFTAAKTLEAYDDNLALIEVKDSKAAYEEYMEMAKANMEKNIVPIIERNPQTEFYIFYPPYSVLYWDMFKAEGTLEANLAVLEYMTEVFLQYDNVTLTTFQESEDIVLNLDLYKDPMHYNIDINSYIIKNLDNPQYQITKENYLDKMAALRSLIDKIDIDELKEYYLN